MAKGDPLLSRGDYGIVNEECPPESVEISKLQKSARSQALKDLSASPQAVAEAAHYGRGLDEELHFQELRGA
jgi:hypothetical protein